MPGYIAAPSLISDPPPPPPPLFGQITVLYKNQQRTALLISLCVCQPPQPRAQWKQRRISFENPTGQPFLTYFLQELEGKDDHFKERTRE